MKAYSMDLRERIVQAVAEGTAAAAVARRFRVGRATVDRYLRRHRAGALAPRTSPGRPPRIGPPAEPSLRAQLEAAPDATLAEHVERWEQAQGSRVSVTTMHRAIARLGWTRKKRPSRPASRTR
jgi:transposase